jgi:hypothetical protein
MLVMLATGSDRQCLEPMKFEIHAPSQGTSNQLEFGQAAPQELERDPGLDPAQQ